jgi:hypothetical protein
MGNVAGYRQAFADAQDYREQWRKYERDVAEYQKKHSEAKTRRTQRKRDEPPVPPKRDLKLETLVGAMNGDIKVHIHCYRSDEMAIMLDLSKEFGFKISAFHHAIEAYKIADLLAANGVCGAEWADWWGSKMEMFDGIQENMRSPTSPKAVARSCIRIPTKAFQRLNQEAAKAMSRGNRIGLNIAPGARDSLGSRESRARARHRSISPARSSPARWPTCVIWNGTPFSVYALAEQVFVDGQLEFDRANPAARPRSDFLLGQPGAGHSHGERSFAIALLSCVTLANAQTCPDRGATVHTVGEQGVLNNTRRADSRRQDRGGRQRPERAGGRHDGRCERSARAHARLVRRTVGDRVSKK